MTRIDFYILGHTEQYNQNRHAFAVKICEKAIARRNKIVIQTQSKEDSLTLSAQLWEQKAESFLAHDIMNTLQPTPDTSPIIIGDDITSAPHHDILINLTSQRTPHFSHYNRLIEIVDQQPQNLKASRENFSFFKQRGYDIQVHKL